MSATGARNGAKTVGCGALLAGLLFSKAMTLTEARKWAKEEAHHWLRKNGATELVEQVHIDFCPDLASDLGCPERTYDRMAGTCYVGDADLTAAIIRQGACAQCPRYDAGGWYLPAQREAGAWRGSRPGYC